MVKEVYEDKVNKTGLSFSTPIMEKEKKDGRNF